MKRKIISIILSLMLVGTICLTACGDEGSTRKDGEPLDAGLTYPTKGYADKNSDSWKQLTADDKLIEIDWYLDSSTFSISDWVLQTVEKNCKVKINMSYPVNDTGDKLSTMISGDMLPDVITITDSSTRAQLQEEGCVYALNRLADKYAPTLNDRITKSEYKYYEASDGNLYTLSNNFYTDEAVAAYTAQGKTLLTNGCFNVRADYLYAYLEYKYKVKRTDADFFTKAYTEVTTPTGFVEMCKWVKTQYNIANNIPMAVIDNNTMNRIGEYFCVPAETATGEYIYPQSTSQMKEAYMFLNELYRNNILTSGSLSATNSVIGQNIANGNVFFSMLTSQNFTNYFKLAYKDGIEYVPIVITNAAGDAPLLRNLAGYGFRCSLITKKAHDVDRIIKVFDYLMSAEAMQEQWYGEEGVTFDYDIRPGEKVGDLTYMYGKAHYSQAVYNAVSADSFGSFNIRKQSLFYDPMYARLSSEVPEAAICLNDYVLYNMKAPLNKYTYNRSCMDFTYDTQSSKYNRMINLKSTLENLWKDNLAQIITQSTKEKASAEYDAIYKSAEDYGLDRFVEYQNSSFQQYKTRLGYEGCAWIKNQPGYTQPAVTLFGDVSEKLALPTYLQGLLND